MADAMGLALGRIDAGSAASIVAALGNGSLPQAKRQDLLRRLLAEVRLVGANCRAGTMLGIAERDLPVPVNVFWPFPEAEQLVQSIHAATEPHASFRTPLSLKSPNGTVHVRYSSWIEEGAPAGELAIGLVDVRDQVQAENKLMQLGAQMAHADRLSTLGVMSATIAHEVRQPLSAMLTSAQAALRWLRQPNADLGQVEDCLNTIVLGASKAEETVARLRMMASNKRERRASCALSPLIEETAEFLRQELASRQATLLLDIPEGLGSVVADSIQLRQVLINLIMNAAQAMADAHCWSRAIKVRARPSDGRIVIDVEDSGPGISEVDRERLFEGFYSTKATGLGLGLRICRQIVEDHGGTLEHLSKATAGSIFRFTVPQAA
jgi:signal transduction histidine kinase